MSGNLETDQKSSKSPIMTLNEIAKYLGCHPMTCYRLLKTKQIPGFKVGGQWRTRKDILDAFIAAQFEGKSND